MENNNVLYLRKCAYLFDDTNTRVYYGTREMIEEQRNAQKELKTFYSDAEKRKTPIQYTVHPDSGRVCITLNGKPHALNAIQIASAEGVLKDNAINYRKHITPEKIEGIVDAWRVNVYRDHFNIYNKKFSTLEFEFFTGAEDLGYIRAHFKNNYYCFAIDQRTNALLTDGTRGAYRVIYYRDIENALGITSDAAKKAFYSVIRAITHDVKKNA